MNEKPVTVALFDEHLIVREAVWNALGSHGIQVVAHAATADEFYAAVARSLPNIALMG
jgi:DNA-binding NarL/FixJ family response regulator